MLFVEIVNTPYKLAQGLMFRRKLGESDGMLFEFKRSQNLSFWGRNTYMPLDIAFVRNDGVIEDISAIKAMSDEPVASSCPCKYAIEANFGFFKSQHIKTGYRIDIKNRNGNSATIEFYKPYNLVVAQAEDEKLTEDINGNLRVYTPEDVSNYLVDTVDIQQEGDYEDDISRREEQYISNKDIDSSKNSIEEQEENEEQEEKEKDIYNNLNKVLRIVYRTKGSEVNRISPNNSHIITREIEPHGIYGAKNGNTILVSYDRTVNDIRNFIIGNIIEMDILDETFEQKFIFKEF